MTREDIFKTVDHTLLAQTATWEEIKEICDDAIKYQTASVCIPASYVKRAKDYVDGKMAICTVIGFPNGNMTTKTKIKMCEIVTEAGADFIKTSTGFSTSGATFDDIALFKKYVGENVKIKAAGGISSFDDAKKFIELGADRLGTSRLVKIAKAEA